MEIQNADFGQAYEMDSPNQESITLATNQVSIYLKKHKVFQHGYSQIKKSQECSVKQWTIAAIVVFVFVLIIAAYFLSNNMVYSQQQAKREKNSLAYNQDNTKRVRKFKSIQQQLQRNSQKFKQKHLFGVSTLNKYDTSIPRNNQQTKHWKYVDKEYEYDVDGAFSLWNINSTYKKQLFFKYKSLALNKKNSESKDSNDYIEINYGKDEQFTQFAKEHQSTIKVIKWSSIKLSIKDMKRISHDFETALLKRKTNLQRLLKKYQEQYEGKEGLIDPKKNITYKRFLQSLEYQKLTGQNFKKNSQLKKIYLKEKQYYRRTYKTDKTKYQIPACIVAPTYNNVVDYRYLWHLQSILQQDYKNYKLIIIDDASTDQTALRIAQHLKWRNADPKKIILIQNKNHKTAMSNIYYGLHKYCDYNQIFYILDGDDEIVGTQVFKLYNSLYQQKKSYMLYSSHFQFESKNQFQPLLLGLPFAYPEQIKKVAGYRTYDHAYSQLRTVMTDFFLLLNTESLRDEYGQFYWTISDNALFFSAMELSCGRVDYIPQLQYWYNADTSVNDWRTTQQKSYRRVKQHINFQQRHYQCIHSTIRKIRAAVETKLQN